MAAMLMLMLCLLQTAALALPIHKHPVELQSFHSVADLDLQVLQRDTERQLERDDTETNIMDDDEDSEPTPQSNQPEPAPQSKEPLHHLRSSLKNFVGAEPVQEAAAAARHTPGTHVPGDGQVAGLKLGAAMHDANVVHPKDREAAMQQAQRLRPATLDALSPQKIRHLSMAQLGSLAGTDKIWHHGYHRFYEPALKEYRDKPVKMMEIGVYNGASLKLWEHYFQNHQQIVGLDIADKSMFQHGKTKIYRGDQASPEFLDSMLQETGTQYDIIIDDGSHQVPHQITSFEHLFPRALKPGGVYIVEDIETSYWKDFGKKNPGSAVNKFKSAVDRINKEYHLGAGHNKASAEDMIGSITFAQNTIIMTKKDDHYKMFEHEKYRFSDRSKPQQIEELEDRVMNQAVATSTSYQLSHLLKDDLKQIAKELVKEERANMHKQELKEKKRELKAEKRVNQQDMKLQQLSAEPVAPVMDNDGVWEDVAQVTAAAPVEKNEDTPPPVKRKTFSWGVSQSA